MARDLDGFEAKQDFSKGRFGDDQENWLGFMALISCEMDSAILVFCIKACAESNLRVWTPKLRMWLSHDRNLAGGSVPTSATTL